MTTLGLLVILFLGQTLAQIHLGPIGAPADQEVDCYTCDDHHHSLPGCLNRVHKCHRDEVCLIKYGNGASDIHCKPFHECRDAIRPGARNCTGGGLEIDGNKCQKCCTTTDCVSDLVNLLKIEAATSDNLKCPGECRKNRPEDCVAKATTCRDGQYCKITKEENWLEGECMEDHDMRHCQEEKRHHAREGCDGPGPHPPRCVLDCCTTNDCFNARFGITTAAPTTTMAMSTMPATTPAANNTGVTLWERLNGGKCKDQLAGDGCMTLMKTADVCHDRLALDICPEACGLCDAVNGAVCKDTIVNDGCADLKMNSDVCNDALAVFICPNTCNLCDELVNSIITSLIDGTSNATDVPPSLLPPSANPSDFPTFNCGDLDSFDCGVLDGLCSTSFVKVVCPDKCGKCTAPIVTVPTTMAPTTMAPTTMAPTTMAPTTMEPTMAPTTMAPTTMAPTTAAQTTAAPTTAAPAVVTGSISVTVDQCVDHLDGAVGCTGLPDVCSSVLALSVCPKFCGLC